MDLNRSTASLPTVVVDGHSLRQATSDLLAARAANRTNVARRQHAAIVTGLSMMPTYYRSLTFGMTLRQLERLGTEGIAIAQHVLTTIIEAGQHGSVLFWQSMRDSLIETARDLSLVASAAA